MRFAEKVCHMLLLAAVVLGVAGCSTTSSGTPADAIYYGKPASQGPIVTLNDAQPYAEAVAVTGGKIVAVGARSDVERLKGANTRMVDLNGRTLIPGFIDAHSHFSQVGIQAVSVNLLPPPDGPGSSIENIQKALSDYIAEFQKVNQRLPDLVVGFDYDDSQLKDGRRKFSHPNRHELDAVSADIPIFLIHQSTHLSVSNGKALANAGITADTRNPTGGTIYREDEAGQYGTPSGLMDENAHLAMVTKTLPKFTPATLIPVLRKAVEIYARNGFTTVQDGRTDLDTLKIMSEAEAGTFKVDVVAYPDIGWIDALCTKPCHLMSGVSRTYTDHFRIGGVKFALDGSPQGKTALFTEPYKEAPEGKGEDYKGIAIFSDDTEPTRLAKLAYRKNWQLMIHANGDAAIDQLIRVVNAVEGDVPGYDRRTVMIHGQYLRADQIPQLKALGIFPSLFPMHTFYWGDWHRDSVAGEKRAAFISPTGAVLKANMKFSIHSDSPVTFPNSMRILDSAVNRTTRSGKLLGADQRLEPIDALKAMTLWAAYQHFEESTKGSIEVGKIADLVVLSDNPLTIDRSRLIDIKILETIKDGNSIYTMPPDEMGKQ